MKKNFDIFFVCLNPAVWARVIALSLLCLGFASTGSKAKTHCISDWSEAAVVVQDEKLVKIAALDKLVRKAYGGPIVKSQLCKLGSDFVYELVVRTKSGQLTRAMVDARKPFEKKSWANK